MVSKNNVPEFLGQIIDIFEDFLAERGVMLQNEERLSAMEQDNQDTVAIIYGSDYGSLQDDLTCMLASWDVIET